VRRDPGTLILMVVIALIVAWAVLHVLGIDQ